MPLPKSKKGVPDNMDEDDEEATVVAAVGESVKDNDDANKDTGDMLVV